MSSSISKANCSHILLHTLCKILDILKPQVKMCIQISLCAWDLGYTFMNYQLCLSVFTRILCNSFSWLKKSYSFSSMLYWFYGCCSSLCSHPSFYLLNTRMQAFVFTNFQFEVLLCVTNGAFFPNVHAVKKIQFWVSWVFFSVAIARENKGSKSKRISALVPNRLIKSSA